MTRTAAALVAAFLCLGIGAFLFVLAATGDEGLNVPPAIAYTAGGIFVVAALRMLQLQLQPASAGNGYAALMLAGFTLIGGWIAVGPGERVCSGGIGIVGVGAGAGAQGLGCRVPFGIGALIAGAMTLYAGWRWARGRRSV